LDFWRADFGLYRTLMERVPRESFLMGKGASICREKIRKAKAHYDLNLATVVEDNNEMFLQIY